MKITLVIKRNKISFTKISFILPHNSTTINDILQNITYLRKNKNYLYFI